MRRGLSVTGVELSAELAEVVRRNVPEAEIVVADFEEFEPERAGFDAVVAFSAFHWVAPELRYEKPARLLRPGGVLAVVHTHHVANDDPFWVDSQQDYDAVVPHQDNEPPPPIEDEPWLEPDAALFPTLEQRRYADERTYSPDDYVALISTYSENIALAQEQRDELLGRLHARAAAQGTVRKRLVYELTVAYLPMG